ncbi:hypothetical protein SERLA73DRAFT_187954 [Serpula lacrymans var. lacrymans S7.3]|uniref:ubiquitinyl hydrolase 1 n=2 Tax=Serpula lacrymans var. lacrymans TaxID=341189 RepID=F8Q9V9_SERL3|nr:uncharacterized protein SERLADRAFT_477873 [Serpula lacrymans var. lacrymans S7.9]EGN94864.1 hypothetical protein SERLA73DRAFT_187954 [Serpula lacrymans var. lacrymans S7.3]EGO20362.1 hypothetical protein SERLADRAFT_477873 [Serpula lacrymans var. lacrymans S7.9]
MTQTSRPPSPPRLKTTGLPDDQPEDDHDVFMSEQPATFLSGHPILPEDMDIRDLMPSQLYEMNQNLLNESVPQKPLIDELASMSVLREEYEHGSASFLRQIDYLTKDGYDCVRRTRGDGDCFYRSVAYAFVERLLYSPDPTMAVGSALSQIESTLPMLTGARFDPFVYEDFMECFTTLIQSIVVPDREGLTLTPQSLLDAFQQPESSNSIVVYLRLLTSAQIRADPDAYAGFLHDPDNYMELQLETFCQHYVEAVGKEADHVQIAALSRALKINVKIAYLDGRDPQEVGKVDFHEFIFADDTTSSSLVLLYRPGHYDVLGRSSSRI